MIRKSLFRISQVSIGNILNAGVGFFFIAVMAKTLPLELFGKYALLTSLLISIAKIMDFGSNSLYVAKTISKTENLTSVFISLKVFLFLVTLPISIIVLLAFKLFSPLILIIFIMGLVAYGVNFSLFALFQKEQNFLAAVLINTFPALIKGIAAVLVLLKIFEPTFVIAFGIFAISMFSCLPFLKLVLKDLENLKISFKGVKDVLVESFPAGTSLLVTDGWSALSNSFAKISGTFTDVGIFSLADKISSIFSLISLSIFTVILPKNAKRKKEKLDYDFKETLLISLLIGILSIFAVIFAQIFINKFFGNKFEDSLKILDILIISSAITAVYSFMRDYFFVEEKTHILLYLSGIRVAVFISSALLLIPTLSISGIAWSNLIASILTLIFTIAYISKRLQKFKLI